MAKQLGDGEVKKGTVVVLLCGGPSMVVESSEKAATGWVCHCVWWGPLRMLRDTFPAVALGTP